MLSSGIAGPYSECIFNFIRNWQTAFQIDCIICTPTSNVWRSSYSMFMPAALSIIRICCCYSLHSDILYSDSSGWLVRLNICSHDYYPFIYFLRCDVCSCLLPIKKIGHLFIIEFSVFVYSGFKSFYQIMICISRKLPIAANADVLLGVALI